ncbi:cytochrome c oxidase subunit II [Pseudogemmobacter faecipullorum]|uniref:Cytochrome c oxidase subunit 2 n=1 Tax=Pseudogemmobacter faecipullorum TaxID=2755041 RepID=A0ABS8CL83_9RHOB|nr:cytochrome c oxidase subunit II [Pseudogemmobacter faecipullorum]MCB5410125.1 cytochrome c oxidase subunit II [Pseudogemmobacter faecipullorum]
MRLMTSLKGAALAGFTALASGSALAQSLEIVGQPIPDGINLQTAVTEIAHEQHWLDNLVLWIIGIVTAFVLLLLLVVILRFNQRSNPVPRKFTHNTPLEIAWTIIPVVLLIFIGVFSIPALNKQQTFPAGDVVVKVTGNQWYWSYEYPEEGIEEYASYMIGGLNWGGNNTLTPETEAALVEAGYSKEQFLLATDTAIVVPVGAKVLLHITATDVIHSWAMPAFAVKQDAVPGRLAQAWFAAEREGIYFGQCSELCGKDHAYMPITVKVVSEQDYRAWVERAKEGDVTLAHTPVALASN